MVFSRATKLLHLTKWTICSVVLATLLIVSCASNPVKENEKDPTNVPQEGITISSDEEIVLPAVSAQLLSSGERVAIQTNQGSATLRYQAPNDSLSELLELQTGVDTITWFERRSAASKRQTRSNTASPEGTWDAFAQKIGNSVYELAAEDNATISLDIVSTGTGFTVSITASQPPALSQTVSAPRTPLPQTANATLSSRIQGVWMGSSDEMALWVWVRSDSISYSYVDGDQTVFVTVDYTLEDSTLKGDEWEMIDIYPRVTKVWFAGDTLVLDITNSVPDGFSPGPREVFRLTEYTGAFPPAGWPAMAGETSPTGPVLPEHSLHNTAWREIQDGQPQEDVLLFGDSLYYSCECWGEYSDCSSPEIFEQRSANFLRLYNWSGDDPYTDKSYHISNDTLYLNNGQDYHMSTFIREHNPCGFDGENQLPTQPGTVPGISVRHEEIIGTWNFSGGTAGEEGGFGMWIIESDSIQSLSRMIIGCVVPAPAGCLPDTTYDSTSMPYTFDESTGSIVFDSTISLKVEKVDSVHIKVTNPDNTYYLLERIGPVPPDSP